MHPMDLLNFAIADIARATLTTKASSKEAGYNAVATLLKLQRELQPPTADDLAEIAVRHGLKPGDFIKVIRDRSQQSGANENKSA